MVLWRKRMSHWGLVETRLSPKEVMRHYVEDLQREFAPRKIAIEQRPDHMTQDTILELTSPYVTAMECLRELAQYVTHTGGQQIVSPKIEYHGLYLTSEDSKGFRKKRHDWNGNTVDLHLIASTKWLKHVYPECADEIIIAAVAKRLVAPDGFLTENDFKPRINWWKDLRASWIGYDPGEVVQR